MVDKRDLFEAAKAHYEQVDSFIASVEAKAQAWLIVLGAFFSAGALSFAARSEVTGIPCWLRVVLSVQLTLFIWTAAAAFSKLLKCLYTEKYEGLPDPGKLLRDYGEAAPEMYFGRYAEYLSEASIQNAARLSKKSASLKEGSLWTRRVLWVLISQVAVIAAYVLWYPT